MLVGVLGLSSSSGASSSPTSFPQDPSSTSSSPAHLRSDDEALRKLRDLPKTQKQNKKRDNDGASKNRLRDLPEWLEEFTDNVEDAEVPAFAEHQGNTVFILTSVKT